jgi:hypothetical protein
LTDLAKSKESTMLQWRLMKQQDSGCSIHSFNRCESLILPLMTWIWTWICECNGPISNPNFPKSCWWREYFKK